MKTHHRCPKCDHGEVLYVPDPRDQNQDQMALGGIRSIWSGGTNGPLEAYVCTSCGYTELYLKTGEGLDLAKASGARVLKAETGVGPFR